MRYFIDIDGTICSSMGEPIDYSKATPLKSRIEKINHLYDLGNEIIYWTARGSGTGELWFKETINQLKLWGCKFHELRMGKPVYDFIIDDRALNANEWFNG